MAVDWMPKWQDYGRPPLQQIMPRAEAPPLKPMAPTPEAAARMVAAELGLETRAWRRIDTPAGPVALRRSEIPHMVQKRDAARERYADRILPTLRDPDEVWMTYYDNGEVRMRWLKVWDDNRGALDITVDRGGNLLYNFISSRIKTLNSNRVGLLVHASDRRG